MNILLAAADYMEEHGWIKRRYLNVQGAACLHGALHKASEIVSSSREEISAAREALTRECRAQYGAGVVTTNDDLLKDKYEAIDLLKRAAKRLEPTYDLTRCLT